MKVSRRHLIRSFYSDHSMLLFVTIFSGILVSLVHVLLPLSIGKFYDLFLKEHTAKGNLIDSLGLSISSLEGFFIFFFGLVLLRGILGYFSSYLNAAVSEKFGLFLLNKLFNAQMSQTMDSFLSRPVSKYVSRYGSDMSAIRQFMTKGILGLIADLAFLLLAFMVLFRMNTSLTFIVAVCIPVFVLITWLISKLQEPIMETRNDDRASMINFVSGRLTAFFTVKAFNRENAEIASFDRRSKRFLRTSLQFLKTEALLQALLPFSFFAALGVVMVFTSVLTENQPMSGSTLLVFILLLLYMQGAFKRIVRIPAIRQKGINSFENLISILNLPAEKKSSENVELASENLKVSFLNVNFSANGNAVLNNFTADFEGNRTTVITGAPGSGKSTILKLILGLIEANGGEISINNISISSVSMHQWRRQMTLCSEEAPLLGATVFAAISYSKKDEKRDKVEKMLGELAFKIPGFEDVLNFPMDDGGKNLSQGQRKKLFLARALLTGKNLILCDEPFSGMDEHSKHMAVEKLNKLKGKRTLIVVSNEIPDQLMVDKFIRL